MYSGFINKTLKIGDRLIGYDRPVFIIAEAGVNHNGDVNLAKKLIDAAVFAGADAVKFQTFQASTLVSEGAKICGYQKNNIGKEESQYDMLRRLELPREHHKDLKDYCEMKGIVFLSTPFTEEDADFLEGLGIEAYKIPSGEITNLPYLEHIAKKGKPIVISTGMSSLDEVRQAKQAIELSGNNNLVFLHCTSDYPAKPRNLNLRAIRTMQTELGTLVGYSDHSEGYVADIAAVALGVCMIEKHFTLDRIMPGPDHKASLEPEEFKEMVGFIRKAEEMLGDYEKQCTPDELEVKKAVRKSIFAQNDIPVGREIAKKDLVAKRPGIGISPSELKNILGKKAKKDIKAGSIIQKEDYE